VIYLALLLVGTIQTLLVLPPLRKVLHRLDVLEDLIHGRNRQEGPPAAQKQADRQASPKIRYPSHPLYL
jgi:hypothetical protein